MVTALLLFHQPYVHEIIRNLAPPADGLEFRALLDSPCKAREFLKSETVDVVVGGSTFIEEVGAVVTSCNAPVRPMSVAVCLEMSAALCERAHLSEIDLLIDISVGLDAARKQMLEEFMKFKSGQLAGSRDHLMVAPISERIHIHDDIDREVIIMIAAGYTDREIAGAVCLSHQTVRNRISRILGDSGARNRTHLACMYLNFVHEGLAPFEFD